jgi:hypothetical protein
MDKLFIITEPAFESTDLTMGTGTRVYLKRDGISKLLDAKHTKLASTRRQHAIAIYVAWKPLIGIVGAKEKQEEFLHAFTYVKRGPILLSYDPTDLDKLKPLYALSKLPARVSTEWFTANKEVLSRKRSVSGLDKAKANFDEFVKTYKPGNSEQVMTWFNQEIAEVQEQFTKQYQDVSA